MDVNFFLTRCEAEGFKVIFNDVYYSVMDKHGPLFDVAFEQINDMTQNEITVIIDRARTRRNNNASTRGSES